MVGYLPSSMNLRGCGDAQSYMTVARGLFSSTFPFFLEFRVLLLASGAYL